MAKEYEFEDIRQFFLARSLFARGMKDRNGLLLQDGEYEQLKGRELVMTPARAALLRAYIDGYLEAKR